MIQMGRFLAMFFVFLAAVEGFPQVDIQPLVETQKAFERAAVENGMKSAFLEFLGDDAVIFRPEPVNGKQYWTSQDADPSALLVRNSTYSDLAANGLLGYTTGNWRVYQKGKTEGL